MASKKGMSKRVHKGISVEDTLNMVIDSMYIEYTEISQCSRKTIKVGHEVVTIMVKKRKEVKKDKK